MPTQPGLSLQTLWKCVGSIAIVGAVTYVGARVTPVNATAQGFLFLISILFVATGWGLTEAVVASIAAVFCYNYYFLPPIGTLTIQDPQNWVALAAFLVTAITASRLSSQAKRQAIEILAKQEEMERLYSLSRALLLTDHGQPVAKRVADRIAQAFGASAVVLFTRDDGAYHRAGPAEFPGLDAQLQQAATEGTQFQHEDVWITTIRLGGAPIGSLGISGVHLTDSAVQSLANLAAIGLERARAQEAANEAEVARQSDELKSILLDAIAHEFQTPLTAVKAASSAMLATRPPSPEDQADLLHIIDEETEHLSGLVSDAIHMARIEAGTIRVEQEPIRVSDLVHTVVLGKRSALRDRPMAIDVPAGLPDILGDPELVALALRQLLDNATKYSPPNSEIEIRARSNAREITLTVRDHGRGVPRGDRARLFEKFYRGEQARGAVAGAGLGLAVARAVVEAHHGRIWLEDPAGGGSEFHLALPAAKEHL